MLLYLADFPRHLTQVASYGNKLELIQSVILGRETAESPIITILPYTFR